MPEECRLRAEEWQGQLQMVVTHAVRSESHLVPAWSAADAAPASHLQGGQAERRKVRGQCLHQRCQHDTKQDVPS